ncbi:hypothetical protein HB943_06505 [Listeria weihenstephanensis]|uniref:Integron-associated effector binding protein domain-containing protein n=1 Tax=Listeria weihenstephanensis TaxID=1006155 RepID=A0A841Z5V9_9LIST|nr:effector binding domain-containing protein [Listeria weihenstephanensis]MBC1500249.1 hypothetical protein [Listeria weihenstephanensis]
MKNKDIFLISETRTNNFTDPDVAVKIGGLWGQAQKYQQEGANFYGIYADYESDYKGDYTVSVASSFCPFKEAKTISIPAQKYHAFPVEKDVFATWQEIWKTELDRSYLFDYEEYSADGSIQIYIGLNT